MAQEPFPERQSPIVREMIDFVAEALFGRSRSEAHTAGVCVICGKPPVFTSEAEAAEYEISGICPECWTAVVGAEEE